MAIAPIDLQTLFAQIDKVAKTQASQREGQTIQQAIHGVQLQRKTEQQVQQVNQTQNTGEGTEKVNDNANQKNAGGENKKRQKEAKENDEQVLFLHDPSLGKNIDISL